MGYIIPALESLVSWFQQWIEYKKTALIVKQVKLKDSVEQEDEVLPPVVGFQVNYDDITTPEEEIEPDED